MRSQTEGRASLITTWFTSLGSWPGVRQDSCDDIAHTTSRHPSPASLDPALFPLPAQPQSQSAAQKETIQSSVAHVQPLERELAGPDSRDSHPVLDLVIRFVKSYAKCTTHTHTHTLGGLFRSVQLSATTFVFARRGGAFTVSAHAAVVPASSFP